MTLFRPSNKLALFTSWALALTGMMADTAWAANPQTDPITGEVWQIFTSTADGIQQGFHAATVDDFKRLLNDSNWVARTGSTTAFDYTTGANGNDNGVLLYDVPNINFGPGLPMQLPYGSQFPYLATAAWLQDSNNQGALGIVETRIYAGQACGGGRYYSCTGFRQYNNAAEIASESDLTTKFAAGQFPSYFGVDLQLGQGQSISYFNPLSSYRDANNNITAGTFMIAAVPEPANAILMLLGLIGVLGYVAKNSKARESQAH